MKCFIVANHMGVYAPGIVNETIVRELSKHVEITLLSICSMENISLDVKWMPSVSRGFSHIRFERILFSIFGRNFLDDIWLFRQKQHLDYQEIVSCDVVLSLISNNNLKSLLLGYYLSRKYNKKWIVYSVDAIPAPLGWESNTRFYRKLQLFINKYLSCCNAFFSSNKQMLDYQLSTLNNNEITAGVILTPISQYSTIEDKSEKERTTFLYTGGIYGPRKIDSLLKAFRLYLKDDNTARLLFVGTNFLQYYNDYSDLLSSGNIEVQGFTRDLAPFYKESTVLIDINAYFDNDVFLSSKIVNYLSINRPIISITGLNSPSRNIFTEDTSILHCSHDTIDIYDKLKIAATQTFDYASRKMYIDSFLPQNAIKPLLNILLKDA